MKLSENARNLLDELLEAEINSCEDEDRRKEIEATWSELDTIGTY